jgi:hypothetical protein
MKSQDLHTLSDEALIKAHLQAVESDTAKGTLGSTEAGCVMLEAEADRRARLASLCLELWIQEGFHDAGKVASALLRANQKDWTAARLVGAVAAAAKLAREHPQFGWFQCFPHKPLISAVERAAASEPLPKDFCAAVAQWKAALTPRALTAREERQLGEAERFAADSSADIPREKTSAAFQTIEHLQRIRVPLTEESKLIERLGRVLGSAKGGRSGGSELVAPIDTTDAVGIRLAADTAKGARACGRAWAEMLLYARSLMATTPSPKWLDGAKEKVAALNADQFGACVADWFGEAGKAAPQALVSYREVSDATLLNNCSVETLKGLAWAIIAAGRVDLVPALGNVADACYKKLPNIGPRNVKLGNAAVAALAALEKPEAATQLARLRFRVRHPSCRATIDKALAALSRKTGILPEDLAEMSVPAFGLDKKGQRRFVLGNCSGELHIVDSQSVALRWNDADGKCCESVPADVRKRFPEELNRLRREAKDASAMLAAQSLRLERSFVSDRSWPFETWEQRFLEHPLTGTLARRLLWQLDDTVAIPWEGKLVALTGRQATPRKNTVVSLWHPLGSEPGEVLAWREWLERHEVTQPFKQAYREIYLLTDAERTTETYSNRFAGHILHQHQFAALCQQRGWDYRLQGEFDSHNTPTLHLPAQDLRAEFWVDAVPNHVSARAIFLYVATDQVRFGRPLAEVPPLVFSEIMRDVDLFVGVAGAANDPTWQENARDGRFRTYWEQWSFGELAETGKTRKTVLARLLPKLKIAPQCVLQDKFLVVKSNLRTYKIHLGSGNILMEPNDQYLCIVPRQSETSDGGVLLPFEGDRTLSIILSKAFLLADDSKIKDETITRQIRG